MQSKSELLDVLHAYNEQGIAFNQSGIPLQLMDYREFLNWYTDTGHTRITFEDIEKEDGGNDFYLYERSGADNRRVYNKTKFETDKERLDEYYSALERRYHDDNGTGGIYYTNTAAIARLEDEKDEWQELFEEEDSIN